MAVGFRKWIKESYKKIRSDGLFGIIRSLYYAYIGCYLAFTSFYPIGKDIYSEDWDLIIILDACSIEAIREVADEYDFIRDVDTVISIASNSPEWMVNTFRTSNIDEINNTTYITANTQAERVFYRNDRLPFYDVAPIGRLKDSRVSPNAFEQFDKVYRYGTEDKLNVVPPEKITDRAIITGRKTEWERMIVHYMQPHEPYLDDERLHSPLPKLRKGDISYNEVWEAYVNNLRRALDSVEILLNNIDAKKVIITSDHGEAFGRLSFYGHPVGCPLPEVRKVPWVETSSIDMNEYEPEGRKKGEEANEEEIKSQLKSLGYL